MKKLTSISFLSLLCIIAFSQQSVKPDVDFSTIDSFARTVTFKRDIYTLTRELTDNYPDQLSKTRSIFIWVTNNIRYDYKFFNSGREVQPDECRAGEDCEDVFRIWENTYLEKAIKKHKAVCDGYSRLMKKMCDYAGIKCEVIDGYTKTKSYQIGNAGPVNHAWNAVWLDSSWYLIDPTWAAGYCTIFPANEILTSFRKVYNDYYWMTPYKDFHRNHYPKNGKWAFEPNYTKEKFANAPWFDNDVITKIHLLSPGTGMVKTHIGDTIHFRFNYRDEIKLIQVNSNIFYNTPIWSWEKVNKRKMVLKEDSFAIKRQRYVDFKQKEDHYYEFDYIITNPTLYYLEVLFDHRKAMRFKIKVEN